MSHPWPSAPAAGIFHEADWAILPGKTVLILSACYEGKGNRTVLHRDAFLSLAVAHRAEQSMSCSGVIVAKAGTPTGAMPLLAVFSVCLPLRIDDLHLGRVQPLPRPFKRFLALRSLIKTIVVQIPLKSTSQRKMRVCHFDRTYAVGEPGKEAGDWT